MCRVAVSCADPRKTPSPRGPEPRAERPGRRCRPGRGCYLTLHNAERGYLPTPRRITGPLLMVHSTVPLVWLLILTALIGVRFWDYWSTLL